MEWLKCTVDGYCKGNSRIIRGRGLIKYRRGNMILGFAKNLGRNSNNFFEWIAMWYGIKMLQGYGVDNIVMEGYSKLIIDILQNKAKWL